MKVVVSVLLILYIASCVTGAQVEPEDIVVPEDSFVSEVSVEDQSRVHKCRFMRGAVRMCQRGRKGCTLLKRKCEVCHGDCIKGKSAQCKLRHQHCKGWIESLLPCVYKSRTSQGVKTFPDGSKKTCKKPTGCVDDDSARYGPKHDGSCATLRGYKAAGENVGWQCNVGVAGHHCKKSCGKCGKVCSGSYCDDNEARYGPNHDGIEGTDDDGDCAKLRYRKSSGIDVSYNCAREAGKHCKLTCRYYVEKEKAAKAAAVAKEKADKEAVKEKADKAAAAAKEKADKAAAAAKEKASKAKVVCADDDTAVFHPNSKGHCSASFCNCAFVRPIVAMGQAQFNAYCGPNAAGRAAEFCKKTCKKCEKADPCPGGKLGRAPGTNKFETHRWGTWEQCKERCRNRWKCKGVIYGFDWTKKDCILLRDEYNKRFQPSDNSCVANIAGRGV